VTARDGGYWHANGALDLGSNLAGRTPQIGGWPADDVPVSLTVTRALAFIAALVIAGGVVDGSGASAGTPTRFKRCDDLHRYYRHGVGRPGARDRVRGSTRPVTTFYVNARLYSLNSRLDADRDGVACEKR
jgi:hypothetical protein